MNQGHSQTVSAEVMQVLRSSKERASSWFWRHVPSEQFCYFYSLQCRVLLAPSIKLPSCFLGCRLLEDEKEERKVLGPGARFSKVRVTYRAR